MAEAFAKQGYIHIKDVVSKELSHFITHVLMRSRFHTYGEARGNDKQTPDAISIVDRTSYLEAVQEEIWPYVEQIVGEELLPTYSYARLYKTGNTLPYHSDKDSCEVSITIQLGRSHHYAWPIRMGDELLYLNEGDGVIYAGNRILHGRDVCEGPKNYYSGQLFCHYVRKNGPHASLANDLANRNGNVPQDFFVRFPTYLMDNK